MIVIYFLLSIVLTVVLGLISSWIDRKVTARVQWRVGPPLLQPLYDVIKLLGRETLVPDTAKITGFLIAPLMGLAATMVASFILWYVAITGESGFGGDLVVVIYLLVVPSLALILGGAASGNPHGVTGASREMKLMLGYELALLLAVTSVLVRSGPEAVFTLSKLHESSSLGWAGGISAVLAFIVALMCAQAKLGYVPFDLADAETEIMSGPYVEYSGPPLAIFKLTKAMLLTTVPLFVITVFFGGVTLSGWGVLWFVLKYVLILVLVVLIKNTNPRVRVDQAMNFFWKLISPLAIVAIILAALA